MRIAAPPIAEPRSLPRPVATAIASWVSMVGVDVLLHGGLLAPLYDWDSPFLLDPVDAFVRIPIGYLAFALLAAALAWLLPRIGVATGTQGAVTGAGLGVVFWGALVVSLWSISTADPALLGAWWWGQAAQLATGRWIIGLALGGARMRGLWLRAGAIVGAGLAGAVLLQTLGYARAPVVFP